MKIKNEKNNLNIFAYAFFVFSISRLASIVLIHFFNIDFVINSGVIFGILHKTEILNISINIIFVLILTFLLLYKRSEHFVNIGVSSILGAGLANLFERIFYGGVVDYIKILFLPVFNFADIFLIIGLCIILLRIFNFDDKLLKFLKDIRHRN